MEEIIKPILPTEWLNASTKFFINPTGRFVIGGPMGDCGLTGRKIIVDTYGGMARHGGGAFSGKDPSKVDRSAAYAARYVAKNIVAAGLADRCEIQVSYAIGVAEPTSIMVETFGTEKVPSEQLTLLVREFFDLRPYGLIQMLDLLHPIYKETAAYGHFGREHFPEENRQSGAAAGSGRSEIISALPLFKASLALAFLFTPPPLFCAPISTRGRQKNESDYIVKTVTFCPKTLSPVPIFHNVTYCFGQL